MNKPAILFEWLSLAGTRRGKRTRSPSVRLGTTRLRRFATSVLGGLEALMHILGKLPADLDASLFLVQHTGPRRGALDRILARRAKLAVLPARDGANFERSTVYVAQPDRHLLLESKTMRVVRGPRENLARPAIDPLFRSAAAHQGPRVVGVVLTGLRDDGAAGLQAIHRSGGITVVQDPEDARYPDMPRNALAHLPVDHVVPIARMAELIVQLAGQSAPEQQSAPEAEQALSEQQANQVERSLLVAMRTLEERSRMLHRLHRRVQQGEHPGEPTRFQRERDEALAHPKVLKELLSSLS